MRKTVLLLASMAIAMLAASGVAWATLVKVAEWRMNERSGPMIDSSGKRTNGWPMHVVRTGSTYRFNGSTSRVPVPDDNSLDPANKAITLVARLRVAGKRLDDDSYDVVRKGYATTAGGDYKMEIKRTSDTVGKLHCLFKGSRGRVSKVARPDIVDGRWHTLRCTKTRNSVVARVDGRSYTQTGSAGSISNSSNVMLGAKEVKPRPDDMFAGSMKFVRIGIAR
jgi:hypothetical protein